MNSDSGNTRIPSCVTPSGLLALLFNRSIMLRLRFRSTGFSPTPDSERRLAPGETSASLEYLARVLVFLLLSCSINTVISPHASGQELPPTRQLLNGNSATGINTPSPAPAGRSATPIPPRPRHTPIKPYDFSYRSEVFTEDVTWRGTVFVEKEVVVAPQATLTIEPGTVVRFGAALHGSAALLVQGRIVASGSNELPVRFLSDFMESRAGDWQGIILLASEKNNQMEYCLIEGADKGIDASFSRLALKNVSFSACSVGAAFHDSFVTMSGGGASDCLAGVNLSDGEAEIRQASFSGNRRGIVAVRSSISIDSTAISGCEAEAVSGDDSRVLIRGSSLSASGSGLTLRGCEGTVAGNRVFGNIRNGLQLIMSRIKIHGNDITGNAGIGLRVENGKSVAWGNNIADNGGYDLYNSGAEEFAAIGNWWGERSDATVAARIYGSHIDGAAGKVRFLPLLRKKAVVAP